MAIVMVAARILKGYEGYGTTMDAASWADRLGRIV